MASKLTLALLVVAVLAAPAFSTCVPFGDGDDTGCTPPDRGTLKCEQKFDKDALKLFTEIIGCHVMKAQRPIVFDEEGCEANAEAVFGTRIASLVDGGCPACFTPDIGPLAGAIEAELDSTNSGAFCAGSTPFGGDDTGFVPPDNLQLACASAVASREGAYARGVGKCHDTAAKDAVLARTFDEEGCEQAVLGGVNRAIGAFFARHPHCNPCYGSNLPELLGITEGFVDEEVNAAAYCQPSS